ncbi:MAG: SurA N-terminal domain-containing protein [Alphaproteobacteria bacterium]|nr:SurA N-terminal domain-containing protein [Alphaproteobacteria bacterium]
MLSLVANRYRLTAPLVQRLRGAARPLACALALSVVAVVATQSAAHAQIVALVNGDPITALDVAKRSKLIQMSTQKTPTHQEVLDELIDDKLKVHIGKRYVAEVPKREIENAFANIARRAGQNSDQFAKALTAVGISVDSLKERIHADFVWGQIIRGKFRASLQVGEQEVMVKLQGNQKAATDAGPTYEYTLRPILFVVARGAAPAAYEARKQEAEAFRARFDGCNQGLRAAMTTRDVAVRETIKKASNELGAAQREALNNTPVGKLTPPEITPQGVEFFAVCNKVASNDSDTPAKREARESVFQERYQELSKKYLKELRSQALIEIREGTETSPEPKRAKGRAPRS